MPKASDTSSVQKICRVLRALSVPQPLRLVDVAQGAGLNKATALRLLESLTAEGFVERDEATKRYRLGEHARLMAVATQDPERLRERAKPWLMRLAALSGDTVLLSVRRGTESVCIDREFGDYPLRANFLDVGSRRPLGAGAGSLALLAWRPDAEVDAMLAEVMPRITQGYPRIDEAYIRAKIAESRRQGYVLLLDVIVERMGGLAMPITGVDGRTIAALSIAGLSERLTDRQDLLVRSMRDAVEALSTGQVVADPPPRARAGAAPRTAAQVREPLPETIR